MFRNPDAGESAGDALQLKRRKRKNRGAFAGNVNSGGMLGVERPTQSDVLALLKQKQCEAGTINKSAITEIASRLKIAESEVFGVASFYSLLTINDNAASIQLPNTLRICDGPTCCLHGAEQILAEAERIYADDKSVCVQRTSCIGLCEAAPAIMLNDAAGGIDETFPGKVPAPHQLRYPRQGSTSLPNETRILLRPDDWYHTLHDHINTPPQDILGIIERSGLRGRGGAGYPTGKKWRAVAEAQSNRKFVICNADESEPGTFKDRVLMENNPHQLIEGMILCALVTGASEGIVYIRGEYSLSAATLQSAIESARDRNVLGQNILESDCSFDIQVHSGAGAYICGEETALLESLEGKRGEPRCRPPFPTQSGYFGHPTVVNNVETLSSVPYIISNGAEAWQKLGRGESSGTKLFCISGHVEQPGVYETPMGITPRELIFDLAGGISNDREFKFALCGGAAGSFIPEHLLDTPLTWDSHQRGVPLGSGTLMVADDTVSVVEMLCWVLRFFESESCGKCTPCRIGTRQSREIVERMVRGETREDDIARLRRLAGTLEATSLCGLGQSVAWPIESTLKHFEHEFCS